MVKDELGKTHGRLRALNFAGSKDGKALWTCKCTCGNLKDVTGDGLRTGRVSSCGCYQQESRGLSKRTHGMTKTPTYRIWQNMIARCTRSTSISYKNYGGRGIRVCKRWASFQNFIADMGERPLGKSIERKNNMKDYSPSNCKWATRSEQSFNKRNNKTVIYKKQTKCLGEWCQILKIPYPRTYHRIFVKKWSAKQAFETPSLKPYMKSALDM